MAGDWLKWTKGLSRKPEVFRLANKLGIDRHEVAGRLMTLWEWADDNINDDQIDESGTASVTIEADQTKLVDDIVGVAGFADAMSAVGWITIRNGSLAFPNFARHNGETSKQRALANDRKKRQREGHDDGVTMSRKQRDKSVTREEKNRVSKNTNAGEAIEKPPDGAALENLANEIIAEWRKLEQSGVPGVLKFNAVYFSERQKQILQQQLLDPAWDWRKAMAKFPLKCGLESTLGQFLEGDRVREIIDGRYDWEKDRGPGKAGANNGAGKVFNPKATASDPNAGRF